MSDAFRLPDLPLVDLLPGAQAIADTIWTRFSPRRAESSASRILFVAASADAGTSAAAASASLALAYHLRAEVTLLEADITRPSLAQRLNVPATPGLTELLDGSASPEECRHELPGCPLLHVVPAGAGRPAIPGELATESARRQLRELSGASDYLLVDAPPIGSRTEGRVLAHLMDAALLVLRSGKTRWDEAKHAVERLDSFGIELLGVVLNDYRSDLPFGLGRIPT